MAAALVPAIPVAAKPVAPSVVSTGSAYTAVVPSRLMDTRNAGGPLAAGGTRDLVVAGGTSGVPAGATGVVLNVTVTNTTAASFLTVYPAGTARPLASNLNWVAGNTIPNLVEVPVGTGGAVTFYNSAGSTDVVADLEGYFAAPSGTAGGHVALTPARITDTRVGSGQANAGARLSQGGTLNVQVTGAGGVPTSGVSGAILNVTVVNTSQASFLTVYPAGAGRPLASNVNWMPSQVIPNRVFVPVGTGGQVSVYNQWGTTDVVIDVSGYFTDATAAGKTFTPQNPVRLLDTRLTGGRLGANSSGTLQITGIQGVPAGATAVILNVTVTATTAPSFLTVYPSTASRPTASDLNWVGGVTIPNLTVATLGSTGAITYYNSAGSTDVVIDLFGYFGGAGANSVSVSASPASIAANGTSTSTVTATVTNGGAAVSGDAVTFATSNPTPAGACGTVTTAGTTNSSGVATATYTSSTTAGTCLITATEAAQSQSGSTTITQTSTGNQTYSVVASPTTAPLSTSGSPDAGNVTVTATGLPANATVCVSLFPADGGNAPANSAGTWTFTSSGGSGVAGTAQGEGTTDSNSAFIRSINGAPTGLNNSSNTTRHQCGIGTGTTGSDTFILNSFAPDKAVAVVYTDTNLNGSLNLAASGQPSEAFGISGTVTWQAPGAGIGSYSGLIVQSVDASAMTFQACTTPGTGSTCNTFNYSNAGNTYNYPSPGSSGTGLVPITQAQFTSYLSPQSPPFCAPPCGGTATPTGSATPFVPGDQLDIVNYNPAASSQFTFSQGAGTNGDVPSAPTAVTATYNGSASPAGVILNWTAPNNPDVAQDASNTAMYCVLRADASVGTFGAFTGSGNADCAGGTGNATRATGGAAPARTLTDVSGTASTSYVYKVFATADTNGGAKTGPASAQSNSATVGAATPKTPTSKQSVLTQGSGGSQNADILDAGDTLQFLFDNVNTTTPLTVAGTWSINLLDFCGAEVQVSNTNSTATVSGSGTTLTIAITGAPTLVSPAEASCVSSTPTFYNTNDYGAVKSAAGIGSSVGAWNLAGSSCIPGSSGCPGGTTFTREVPYTFGSPLNSNSVNNNFSLPNDFTDCGIADFFLNTTTNKITIPAGGGCDSYGELNDADPIFFFNGNGVQIASGTYSNASGTSLTPSPALTPGETVYGLYTHNFMDNSGTVSDSKTKWPSAAESKTASVYSFSPAPIAATGSLAASQAVAVTLSTNTPGGTVYLSFTSGATPTASASVGGVALTGSPTAFTADSSGNIFITYTSSSGGNSAANSSVLDTITAQNGPTPASTTQSDFDTYRYAAAPPTAANSTLTSSPGSVPDDNATTSTITVTLKNGVGAPVSGKTVVLNQNSGAHSTINPPNTTAGGPGGPLTTNGSGQATWTVRDAFPETVTYTATDTTDSVVVSQTATVRFFQRVNNTNSTLTATPPGPLTAGTATTITATVLDDSSKPIVGYSVTLSKNIGCNAVITGTNPATTNSSGQATWSVNDNTAQGCTFTASGAALPDGGPGLSKTVPVTWNPGAVTAGNSSATAFPTTGVPDNNDSGGAPAHSNITVTLRDALNNPVPGKNVSLSATTNGAGGSINGFVTTGPATIFCTANFFCLTDANGQVVFRVGDNAVETVTYTATDTTDSVVVSQTPTVGFVNPIYTSAAGTGASLQTTATFTDAVCRIAGAPGVFAAGDWTVSGSVQGPITVVSDNATTCPATGTTTVTLTLASPMATGQTITVTLNASGAAKFNNVTGHAPASAGHTFST